MVLKAKLLAMVAALTGLECVAPMTPVTAAERGETVGAVVVSPTTKIGAISISPLPESPPVHATQVWARGKRTGVQASSARSAFLVLLKDPFTTGRVLAYGWDPAYRKNLFVFTMASADVTAFQQQWNVDVGDWREEGGSSIALTGSTDGIGGNPIPIPRPGLVPPYAWKQAFYAYEMQQQIEQEAIGEFGSRTGP